MQKDLENLLTKEYLEDMAESHIEVWKDRYFRKTKKQIKEDLFVNHDNSGEIDWVVRDLERPLLAVEEQYVIRKFHQTVIKNFFNEK